MLYQPLAVDTADDTVSTCRERQRGHFEIKNVLGVFVSAIIGLYLVSHTGLVHWDGVGFTRASNPSCHYHHKSTKLPTHHILPSGDTIPSVALGTAAAAVNIIHLTI